MADASLTVMFGHNVELRLDFDGPDGSTNQQKLRSDFVAGTNFCGVGDLATGPLADTLRRTSVHVTLVQASLVDPRLALPSKLTPLFPRRATSAFIAMYAFDTRQPCVLAYICVTPAARLLHVGGLVLEHYERHVQRVYACRALYLASVDLAVSFYRRNGYAPMARVPVDADGVTRPVDGVALTIVEETLMVKHVVTHTTPIAAYAEPLDDDDDELAVVAVVYRRRRGDKQR